MKARRYRFTPRAQLIGVLRWACPECGVVGRRQLRPSSTTVRCSACNCALIVGIHFLAPNAGRMIAPRDRTLPAIGERIAPDPIDGSPASRLDPSHLVDVPQGVYEGLRRSAQVELDAEPDLPSDDAMPLAPILGRWSNGARTVLAARLSLHCIGCACSR